MINYEGRHSPDGDEDADTGHINELFYPSSSPHHPSPAALAPLPPADDRRRLIRRPLDRLQYLYCREMVAMDLKQEIRSLQEARGAVELEMNSIISRLSAPGAPGLSGSLVDAEVFSS